MTTDLNAAAPQQGLTRRGLIGSAVTIAATAALAPRAARPPTCRAAANSSSAMRMC